MRTFRPILIDTNTRARAIAEARERGLRGADRPGDDLLMPNGIDPSDTYIGALVQSFDSGRDDRAALQAGTCPCKVVDGLLIKVCSAHEGIAQGMQLAAMRAAEARKRASEEPSK